MSTWTCETCHWSVDFPSDRDHPESCPLCAALGQSASVETDLQGAPPHRWMGEEEARDCILAGEPLRRVYVESIDLDGVGLEHPVEIVDSVLGCWSAREASFGAGLDLSGSRLLGRFEAGVGDSKQLGRFARGARFEDLLRLEGTRFYKGARFEACQMTAGLAAACVHVRGQLDLSGAEIGGAGADLSDARLERLTLRDTRFGGDLLLERATARGEVLISGILVEGLALAGAARFEGEFYLGGSRLVREANFSSAHFDAQATFDASEFHAEFNLSESCFKGAAEFLALEFGGWADLEWARFDGAVVMEGVRSARGTSLDDSIFGATLTLRNVDSMDETHFRRVSFREVDIADSEFRGRVDLRDVCIDGDLRLERVVFGRGLFLARSRFGGPVRWDSVIVGDALKGPQLVAQDSVTWRECRVEGSLLLAGGRFEKAFALPGTAIAGCLDLQQAEFGALADLTGCRFERIRLAGVSAPPEVFQVELRQIRGKLQSERDRDYATAAREWGFLKQAFEEQNHRPESDRAHYTMRKMGNRADRKGPIRTVGRLLEVVFIEWGTGYGTRPGNIVLLSLCTVLALGIFYALVPGIVASGGEAEHVSLRHLILLSFTSFLAWEGASIVLALEAFVGRFLVALFAAIVSRRLFRS